MESSSFNQLFVYSSLRQGFLNKTCDYVSKYFSFVSEAKVKGIFSDVGGSAVYTPALDNSFIKGELYRLNNEKDFSWAFGQLDDYEGMISGPEEKPLYRRELTAVYRPDGGITEAWIYVYKGDVTGAPVINSGDVLEYIKSKK